MTNRIKKWYVSKTLWINVFMLLAIIVQQATGYDLLTSEVQASLIVVINVFLRLITNEELAK